jgi:hypothetical protein
MAGHTCIAAWERNIFFDQTTWEENMIEEELYCGYRKCIVGHFPLG